MGFLALYVLLAVGGRIQSQMLCSSRIEEQQPLERQRLLRHSVQLCFIGHLAHGAFALLTDMHDHISRRDNARSGLASDIRCSWL